MIRMYIALSFFCLLQVQLTTADQKTDSPSFYVPGNCTQPNEAGPHGKRPITDDDIAIVVLSLSESNATGNEIKKWSPDTLYGVNVTSLKKMEVLVGVNGGALSIGLEEANTAEEAAEEADFEDCDGAIWYSTEREEVHSMVWKSPACCTFVGTEVQFFVTGSMSDDDYLRQQAIVVPGEQSKCDCKDGSSATSDPVVTPLPSEKAMDDDTGTHFTDGEEEPEDVISTGGEIDPNADGADEDDFHVEVLPPKKKSSFGYAFLIMLLTIAIALGSIWFYRKYRVRQMRYREFEGLEMRGYAQWSDEAGL